jgi:hypothetical protein
MTSLFWQSFWPTHANQHASANGAGPAPPTDVWRLARVGQNGRQNPFAQAAMQGCWRPSPDKNITNLFVDKNQ